MKNTKSYIRSPIAWTIMASLVLTPVAAFADKGGDDGNRGKSNNGTTTQVDNSGRGNSRDNNENENKKQEDRKNQNNNQNNTASPVISNVVITPGINRAVVTWRTNVNADTKASFSTVSPVNASSSNTTAVSGFFRTKNHRLVLRNLTQNTTYFVVVSSKDRAGNTATGTEVSFVTLSSAATDTVAPIISSLVVTPATSTATVTWNTNEAADSAVFFSTSLPVDTSASATQVVSSDLRITTHSLILTNLSTSTTYFVVVRSRDAAGNAVVSSPVSFTTGTTADITPPSITNLVAVVGTSTLKFLWNTNELATSKVFYSTTTPVNVNSTSTPFVEDVGLVSSHSISLTGLLANTVYHIVVQSKDAATNVSSIVEFPLTTSQ